MPVLVLFGLIETAVLGKHTSQPHVDKNKYNAAAADVAVAVFVFAAFTSIL